MTCRPDATEYVNLQLAIANANHHERRGLYLEKTEELCSLITASMEGGAASVEAALAAPRDPDLELLALLEGKLGEDRERRTAYSTDEDVWKRFIGQLAEVGMQPGKGGGSIFAALDSALDLDVIVNWLEEKGPSYRQVHTQLHQSCTIASDSRLLSV